VTVTLSKHQILGQPINLSTDYWGWLVDRLDQGISTHVITMNAEMVMQANENSELAKILQQADLIAADGAGITIALKLHGIQQQRYSGIDLGEALFRLAADRGAACPVAMYGGKPEILTKTVAFWQRELPELSIVVQANGYIPESAQQELIAQLQQQQPKIILVALGIPRQEVWIDQNRHICPQAIWVGVGGSFDVWSGTKKRAPKVLQDLNLEWLYRLAQEPTRWRRMLVLPQFMWLAMNERLQGKGHP
jgi:N-acetylglucosaminyldiphosphoundecaprenol N-acetyl-beta-D-mannosaminyltransferase